MSRKVRAPALAPRCSVPRPRSSIERTNLSSRDRTLGSFVETLRDDLDAGVRLLLAAALDLDHLLLGSFSDPKVTSDPDTYTPELQRQPLVREDIEVAI